MLCDKVEMPKKRALVEREGKSVFESVENKLKTYAKVNFGLVIGTAILAFIVMVSTLNSLNGLGALLVVILYVILVYDLLALCWFMYAFAEITESTKKTNEALRLTFAKQITTEQEKQQEEKKAIEEKKREEEARKKAEEEARMMESKRRYDAYWETHAEERNSLLAKREEAVKALKSISGLATEERAKLSNLIAAIDEELKKER